MNTFHKVLFVLAILIANCISASAIEFTDNGVRYSVNSDNKTVTVAGYPSGSKPTGDLTIPESVTYGGISYPVTSISYWAFNGCSGLTSVTIPNSVTDIEGGAFSDCTGLTSIKVESGNFVYDSRENCNAIIKTATNRLESGCKNTIIPNSVTTISDYAFYGCTDLTSVTIPNSVSLIDDFAFGHCSGLTSITIPNSVTEIGDDAFNGCTGLTSITIPNSVTSLGEGAFEDCSGLTSVTIPNSVTEIDYKAFSGCYGLTRIDAYPNPEKVGTGDAFDGVPKDGTLHVLPKYLSAYQTASQWCEFTNIKDDLTEIGDINLDGNVEVSDVTTLVNMIHNGETANLELADINGDGKVNVSDVTALVNIILN